MVRERGAVEGGEAREDVRTTKQAQVSGRVGEHGPLASRLLGRLPVLRARHVDAPALGYDQEAWEPLLLSASAAAGPCWHVGPPACRRLRRWG